MRPGFPTSCKVIAHCNYPAFNILGPEANLTDVSFHCMQWFKLQIRTKQNKPKNQANKTKSKSATCKGYQEEKEIHSGVHVSGIRHQNVITQYICQCFNAIVYH